jgi:AcrR family transcriptional regulator
LSPRNRASRPVSGSEEGDGRWRAARDRSRVEDAILDAARETVLDVGVRRATVSEVARRAGLSRMTVYRRHPDAATLLRAVMAREFEGVIARAEGEVAGVRPPRRRLVAATIGTAELLATHPVMVRVLELDPELLLPYLTVRVGRFQGLGRKILAERIAAGQREGWIRRGDPSRMAGAIELSLRGVVIAGASMSRTARAGWLAELEIMIDGYLSGSRAGPRSARAVTGSEPPRGAR